MSVTAAQLRGRARARREQAAELIELAKSEDARAAELEKPRCELGEIRNCNIEFLDDDDDPCRLSIQGDGRVLWLAVIDSDSPYLTIDRELAEKLAAVLARFACTGKIAQ